MSSVNGINSNYSTSLNSNSGSTNNQPYADLSTIGQDTLSLSNQQQGQGQTTSVDPTQLQMDPSQTSAQIGGSDALSQQPGIGGPSQPGGHSMLFWGGILAGGVGLVAAARHWHWFGWGESKDAAKAKKTKKPATANTASASTAKAKGKKAAEEEVEEVVEEAGKKVK
jgi:hypothetical protein